PRALVDRLRDLDRAPGRPGNRAGLRDRLHPDGTEPDDGVGGCRAPCRGLPGLVHARAGADLRPLRGRRPARGCRGPGDAASRPMRRSRRATRIVWRLLPFVIAFLRDRRRWILFGRPARRTADDHRRRAERLTAAIASLGPTFIKLAQVFSARADILPEPYL